MATHKDDVLHDTQISSLFKKVNTPRNPSHANCPKFGDKPTLLTELGHSLGKGGYGEAYIYYSEKSANYRVIKKFHPSQLDGYGGIQRKVQEFNNLYHSIHQGKFKSLATAEIINIDGTNLLDIPYIDGESIQFEQGEQVTELVTRNREQLFEMFKQYGFFLVDYDGQDNIIAFNENGSQFLLIRDIDELGLRDSFTKAPENSTTAKLLNKVKQDRKGELQDFQSILTSPPKKPVLLSPSREQGVSFLIDTIYPKMKSEEKKLAMQQALTMQEVCYIACKNRGSKKQTHTMDLIRDYLSKQNGMYLKSKYNITDKKINVQLRSIGLCGENLYSKYFSNQPKPLGNLSFWKTPEDMRERFRHVFSHKNEADLPSYKTELKKIIQPKIEKTEEPSSILKN